MKKIFHTLSIFTISFLLVSCGTNYKKTPSGLVYKIFPSDEKDSTTREGDYVKLHFVQKINDSIVQSTFGKMPAYARYMSDSRVIYNPVEILNQLKKGDSAVVVLLLDSMLRRGQLQQLPPNTKKSDRVTFMFKVLEIFRSDSLYRLDEEKELALDKPRMEKEREEQMIKMRQELMEAREKEDAEMVKSGEAAKGIKAMEDYLASKNITNAQKLGKGTFVVVDNPGDGAQAGPGKFVQVEYIGSLIRNDSIFDKGTLERKLGQGELIGGMEEGLEAFKAGGKGTLYIPGFRAYGKSHPRFQPFDPMKFEVKILTVSDTSVTEKRMMP